ncbi:MAG: hypothetical protein QOI47_846 [Actinomycetota bacterium]|jgi:hypothetical protein|nr:hypothetical protein [Actinomycetota bacterium]
MTAVVPARTRRTAGAASRHAPSPVRSPQPDRRHLRVVDDARISSARRRRRLRATLVLTGVGVIVSLFALAAFHAMLASGQARLDQLDQRVSDAQGRYESLRLDVAQLEAPSRIVREAQERLGMVPPPGVTYLTPSQTVSAEVGQAAVNPSPTSTDAGEWAAWATVKPYLSGRP